MSRLRIAERPGPSALSPQQENFNTLVSRIAREREQLAAWNDALAAYHRKYAGELRPLLATLHALQVELVQWLDAAAAGQGAGGKAQRQLLHEVIAGMAAELAEAVEDDATRAAMQALSGRYRASAPAGRSDAGADAAQASADMQADDDAAPDDSPEAILQRVEDEMHAAQARVEAHRQRHQAGRAQKASARQRRAQAAAQQASQSVRAVYRKLASALHPDREPDEAERVRKTALMQRVNQAYAAGHLLDLLQLQLEVEQIDPLHIAGLSDERLQHYNQVLADQLAELQQEVRDIEQDVRAQCGLPGRGKLSPRSLAQHGRAQGEYLRMDIAYLRQQRETLEDPTELRRWLKAQRAALREAQEGLEDGAD